MKYFEIFFFINFMILIYSCKNSRDADLQNNPNNGSEIPNTFPNFFYGADLSCVNKMEDCGAIYFDNDNIEKDVYEILANKGANKRLRKEFREGTLAKEGSRFEKIASRKILKE